jgi:hypothetical protein
MGALLKKNGCNVVGVDVAPLPPGIALDGFRLHDLNLVSTPEQKCIGGPE